MESFERADPDARLTGAADERIMPGRGTAASAGEATGEAAQCADDALLLAAFEAGTYPFEQWNHRAHVRVGFVYLSQCPLEEAIDRMRSGIRSYNARHGVQDGPETGYHETITQAFMRLIHRDVQERGPFHDSNHFCDSSAELLNRRVLLRYYTRERIMSPEAKAAFVEPDLAPL